MSELWGMTLKWNGEWTLHEAEYAKYIVRQDGVTRATGITDEFHRGLGVNVGLNWSEMLDCSEVEAEFDCLSLGEGGLI